MERRTFVHALGAMVLGPAAVACAMPHGTAGPGSAAQPRGRAALHAARRGEDRPGPHARRHRRHRLHRGRDADVAEELRPLADGSARHARQARAARAVDARAARRRSTTSTLFVDEAKILGHKYLILADVPSSGRQSLATFAAFADRLNRAGEAARKHDLWIAWHDEADDFKSFGGQQGYDALVARLDPSLVRLQLDTGNAAVGGRDPLDLMKRYGDRYYSFHIKDAPSIPAEHDVELGKGVVNLAASSRS